MLVLWQMATNRKYFRPRLGSPITRVSCAPGDQYFAVCLQSNGKYTLIKGTLNQGNG